MATKKAASTKKATAKKPAAANKTTVRTKRADAKATKPLKPVVRAAAAPAPRTRSANRLPENIVNIVFAELVGTFVLTLIALATFTENGALYVGLALTILVMGIGAVSGSHVNPAVTFGLWAARRLKTVLVPFYWGAQFLGAMLAVIVINWVSNNSLSLSFDGFTSMNWSVFGAELVATAIFLFGLIAVSSQDTLSKGGKALGIGLSLAVGLVAGGTLYTSVRAQAVADYQSQYLATQQDSKTKVPEIPHIAYVKGVTANPAVALAVTDRTEAELNSSSSATKETAKSRLSLEVIFGTLVGAALGGNLYLLVAGRKKD